MPVWRKSWWQGVWYKSAGICFWQNVRVPILAITPRPGGDVRLFPDVSFYDHHRLALYSEHSQYAIFAPFRYVVNFSTGRAATQWTFTAGIGWGVADWRVCDRSCLHGAA